MPVFSCGSAAVNSSPRRFPSYAPADLFVLCVTGLADKSTPLVVDPSVFLKEKGKAKAARWFSNPLFQKLGADDDDAKDGTDTQ